MELDGEQFPPLVMLGMLSTELNNFAEAETLLKRALVLNPDDVAALFNYGSVLTRLNRFEDAFVVFEKVLSLNPSLAEAHLNRGGILILKKRFAEALACFDAAININPNIAAAHCNRAQALELLRRLDEALLSCEKAISLEPRNAEYHATKSNILHAMGRYSDALESILVALSLRPDNAALHYNYGNILFEMKRYDAAFGAYDQAFRLDPNLDFVEGDRLFAKRLICHWDNLEVEQERLAAGVRAKRLVTRPFAFLSASSSKSDQLICATAVSRAEFSRLELPQSASRTRNERIKVAYLSADFREHPTSHLLAGMIEHHDHAKIESIAISFGRDDKSDARQRMRSAFDLFIDVRNRSDLEIAQWMQSNTIDIAVDLMGLTQHARPAILAYRPAPVQVSYLGFPGTTGASYIDYLFADELLIPVEDREFYAENVVYLPGCYQVNDNRREVSDYTPTRKECSLPEDAVVFCCFNQPYKISPTMFDIWMRLLTAIDGSVLWLIGDSEIAIRSLRAEAARRGVAPGRLIFAPKVKMADHLARHRLADLVLDTLPYNAHTTASDALWVGVPLVTCVGSTFAGRVAASLLEAVGLEELTTKSLPEYEALALNLARAPTKLGLIRARLAANRDISSLFDTKQFTRNVESAFETMMDHFRAGICKSFSVDPPIRT